MSIKLFESAKGFHVYALGLLNIHNLRLLVHYSRAADTAPCSDGWHLVKHLFCVKNPAMFLRNDF
jgi:hypothetical protein